MVLTRILAGLTALIALSGMALRTVLNISANLEAGKSAGAALWHLAGVFTIWGNIAVVVVAGAMALAPASRLAAPSVRASVASAIVIIGLVFTLMLRYLLEGESDLTRLASHLMHDASPIAFVLVWLLAGHGTLRWHDAAWSLLLPGLYLIFVLIRGMMEGFAPYWFLDYQTLGIATYARNATGLAIAFAVVGLVLVALDRVLPRRAGARAAGEVRLAGRPPSE